MSRGDSVTVVVDLGNGASAEHQFVADKNGRKFEVVIKTGQLIVQELTMRGEHVVRTARFMAARVISCIEEPIEEDEHVSEPTRLGPMFADSGIASGNQP